MKRSDFNNQDIEVYGKGKNIRTNERFGNH